MTKENLKDDHHVVGYIKPSLIDDSVIDGTAFALKKDEEGLSINWPEIFSLESCSVNMNKIR